jgi:DUF971 family protein
MPRLQWSSLRFSAMLAKRSSFVPREERATAISLIDRAASTKAGGNPHTITAFHHAEDYLEVTFENEETLRISSDLLRAFSQCASNRSDINTASHRYGNRRVRLMRVSPVGRYALNCVFDDMHDTGIYTFEHLYALGKHPQEFIDQLKAS